MNDENDILKDAITELKNHHVAGPPEEVVGATLEQLAHAGATEPVSPAGHGTVRDRIWPVTRLAAAAAILIFVGFSIGRGARSEPLDLAQLRQDLEPAIAAALEPAIREKLTLEMSRSYEVALAGTYVRLKDELTQQHRDDMNRYAMQTLAASNAVTNRLLADLRDSIKTEQTNDLRSVAAALQRLEHQRIADKELLAVDLASVAYRAYQTENRLRQTEGELVQLLVDTRPPRRTATDPNERSMK